MQLLRLSEAEGPYTHRRTLQAVEIRQAGDGNSRKPRISQRIQLTARKCPACGGDSISESGRFISKKLVYDLRFTVGGVKTEGRRVPGEDPPLPRLRQGFPAPEIQAARSVLPQPQELGDVPARRPRGQLPEDRDDVSGPVRPEGRPPTGLSIQVDDGQLLLPDRPRASSGDSWQAE